MTPESFTVARALKRVVGVLERVVAGVLVVLIVFALIGLCVEGWRAVSTHGYLLGPSLLEVIEGALAVFVLIELFSIAVAYFTGARVVRTVLEAALVAVVRKLIAFEPGEGGLGKGIALAALLVAVALAWYLLGRSGALPHPEPKPPPVKE